MRLDGEPWAQDLDGATPQQPLQVSSAPAWLSLNPSFALGFPRLHKAACKAAAAAGPASMRADSEAWRQPGWSDLADVMVVQHQGWGLPEKLQPRLRTQEVPLLGCFRAVLHSTACLAATSAGQAPAHLDEALALTMSSCNEPPGKHVEAVAEHWQLACAACRTSPSTPGNVQRCFLECQGARTVPCMKATCSMAWQS